MTNPGMTRKTSSATAEISSRDYQRLIWIPIILALIWLVRVIRWNANAGAFVIVLSWRD